MEIGTFDLVKQTWEHEKCLFCNKFTALPNHDSDNSSVSVSANPCRPSTTNTAKMTVIQTKGENLDNKRQFSLNGDSLLYRRQ